MALIPEEDLDIVKRQTTDASKRGNVTTGGSSGVLGAISKNSGKSEPKPKADPLDPNSPQAQNLRAKVRSALGMLATGDLAADLIRLRLLREEKGVLTSEWAGVDKLLRNLNESKIGGKSILSSVLDKTTTDALLGSWFKAKQKGVFQNQRVSLGNTLEGLRAEAAEIEAKILGGVSGGQQSHLAARHTEIVGVFSTTGFDGPTQDFSELSSPAQGGGAPAAPAPATSTATARDSFPQSGSGTIPKQEPVPDAQPDPSPTTDPNPLSTLSPSGSPPAGGSPSPVGSGPSGGSGATGSSAAASGGVAGEGGAAVQVPGEYQLWQIDGQRVALAYKVPGEDMFLTYDFPDPATLQALFPAGVPGFDAVMSSTGINGVLLDANGVEVASFIGDGRGVVALNNTSEHPFANMEQTWALRAERNEAYSDPDFLAKLAETIIEGRTLTQDDLYEIDSIARNPDGSPRTDAEIARTLNIWTMSEGEYERGLSGIRETVRRQLAGSGVVLDENSEGIITYMAGQVFAGSWQAEDVALQANILSGASRETLDAGLQQAMEGVTLNTLPNQIDGLRAEAERWLGPAVAGNLADSYFRHWAQEILQDPNKQGAFTDSLRGQFATNFNNFTNNPNGNLTYEDIAPTYRGMVQKIWGEHADENDPFFVSLLQGNDMEAAAKALRKKGLDMGKSKITSDVLSSMGQAFGGQVARSL